MAIQPGADVDDDDLAGVRLRPQRADVFRAQLGLQQVGLPAGEPQQLGVLVRDDLQREPVEVRQRDPEALVRQ